MRWGLSPSGILIADHLQEWFPLVPYRAAFEQAFETSPPRRLIQKCGAKLPETGYESSLVLPRMTIRDDA